MPSPLFGVEALVREPRRFAVLARRKPERIVRSGHPRAGDDRPRKALPTREERSRAKSPDDVAAA